MDGYSAEAGAGDILLEAPGLKKIIT